jgi:NAD(P)H dehydrogenase (quinone)
MPKIIVIYHSQQFGNTKLLAEALAEGARQGGAEVELINTNERRITVDEFLAADAVASAHRIIFLCRRTIKTFFDDLFYGTKRARVKKSCPTVYSWGRRKSQRATGICPAVFNQVSETVE